MSSKYSRYLLSTCLPLLTLAVCIPNVANAGFEWTPPEKMVPPVEVMPAPDMLMPPAPVESEVIEDSSMIIDVVESEEEEPIIEIIVIDDTEGDIPTIVPVEESMVEEVPENIEIIVIENDAGEEVVADIREDTPIAVIEEIIVVDDAPLGVDMVVENHHENEDIVIETMDIEASEAPAKESGALVLNPYPLESEAVDVEPEAIVWNAPEVFEVIEGFGSDMPLALALRQIVPAKYAFSFGSGVNPGARISWQGDKPWNEVLSEAVAPIGVKVEVRNKKVLLSVDEAIEPKKEIAKKTEHILEHAKKENKSDTVMARPENDIATVEEDVNIIQAVEQDSMELNIDVMEADDASETQAPSLNDGMNDALREVYGNSASPSENSGIPDAQPLQLDSVDDMSDMVEELLEPVNIVEDQEIIMAPDISELSSENGDTNETVIDRGNILDPGESEGIQPNISEEDDLLMEQKKN